ncbi:MAG: aminoacyl-histidine dipeptidase [Clostridiales bacterium]|nr:aminoacyl-histidine dipeptidase [Clostridiales bacterium]
MSELNNLQPKEVFDFFKQICAIPHGSRNTKQISDYLVKFAEDRNLEHYQDDVNNVIVIKEATKGYEKSAPIIIQGHMDMVCDKTPESDIDMAKEGLRLCVDGDWLYAEGTTLGGDDGIAVAMALAAMDSSELQHPRLECIFTVDEEIGMLGAEALDMSHITAEKMLNIDSEDEGIFTVSCAGGVTAKAFVPVKRAEVSGKLYKVTVGGLLGGHSGQEIDKERGNSNIIMGRVLYNIAKKTDIKILSLGGGVADNAICKKTEAEVIAADGKKLEDAVKELDRVIKHEFKTADPGVAITSSCEGDKTVKALDADSVYKVITYLMNSPYGIQHMSMDIEGLVETSLNLGALALTDTEMTAMYAVRSAVETRRDALCDKLESLSAAVGGKVEYSGAYPGWEYLADSEMRDTSVRVYKAQYGEEPKIEAIHAGLECGLFAGKMDGKIDAVSIGPDMTGVHTSEERLSIPSVERTWKLVCEILKESK